MNPINPTINISHIQTGNTNPNFTLVLPGPCQAACGFCNWKQDDKIGAFMIALEKLIGTRNYLPSNFKQISISGGEPTLSPVFGEVMELLKIAKDRGIINKVVLTTNGWGLNNHNIYNAIKDVVDHVNISRHHYDQAINAEIFKTDKIPNNSQLAAIIEALSQIGIDTTFNCVFTNSTDYKGLELLDNFITLINDTGATSVTFRNQYDNFEKVNSQLALEITHQPKIEQSCPVCITTTFLYKGRLIKFHRSSYEPTESPKFDENETYELILHGNGKLTRDWEGLKEIDLEPIQIEAVVQPSVFKSNRYTIAEPFQPSPIPQPYSSCGNQGSYSSCGNAPKIKTECEKTYSSCGQFGGYMSCR